MNKKEQILSLVDEINERKSMPPKNIKENESMTVNDAYLYGYANVISYDGDVDDEIVFTFANRTKESAEHYKMIASKVIELGGIIKETHPGTRRTVVKFYGGFDE